MKAVIGGLGALLLALVLFVPVIMLGARDAETKAATPLTGNLDAGKIPKEYRKYVEAAGKVCAEVPAAAIAAQIKQESGWDPNAVSQAGAEGLTQFMPGTWPTYQRDANGNGTASPRDPADAIDAQARYMCDLAAQVEKYAKEAGRPTIELAWAAYNAGPGAVQQHGGIPPFGETQAYVNTLRSTMSDYVGGGTVKASGKWAAPLSDEFMIPTSGFGGRDSPCAGCSSNHQGQDLGAHEGTPIYAACTGVVDFSGQMSGYGNIIFINCGDGVRTGYAHQSQLQASVGDRVTAGKQIGLAGSTGVGTDAHLHFEVRINAPNGGGGVSGTAVDPRPFMAKKGITW